jgi:hypothetical protein
MNQVLAGITTNDSRVSWKTLASIRVNSDSVSNEIEESDLHSEKHSEQRI